MKLLNEEEGEVYSEVMDKVAILIYKHTMEGMAELGGLEFSQENSTELGWAVGQVMHDEILELTKDIDPVTMSRWFTETTISLIVSAMVNNPRFFSRIADLTRE